MVTPAVSLGTYSPSPAGASNATGGLVAGASNSTLDNVVYAPRTVFSVTHWYGPDAEELGAAEPETITEHGMHHERMHHERPFDAGIAAFQSSEGLATLAGLSKPGGKASRTITNQDVDQLNQNNGTVKYRGKTEKL